ncbi:Hypothetical protein A7982_07576 [Minicystis rosea]|nr:Hypothetical protein A7982_07576 [Minicystis rosea]
MKSALPLLVVLMLGAAGCAGWISVDGYEAEYASAPAEIERYPRYSYRGTYVYEVQGRYYRRYGNRWVAYRSRPADLRHDHDEKHDRDRGRR